MLAWRFAVHLNRSLVGLLGIVIERTDVVYLRSFPCVVVKRLRSLLVNRLPKIQTEAEFSILMSKHFVGFTPSGGTRN